MRIGHVCGRAAGRGWPGVWIMPVTHAACWALLQARTVGEFEMTEQHLGSVRTSVVLDVEVPDALGGRRPSV